MMTIGTANFVSLNAAVKYYADYGYTREEVKEKIANGDIAIGVPVGKGTYELNRKEGRYFLTC